MASLKLTVTGMHCGHCKMKVEKALQGVAGTFCVAVFLDDGAAEVDYDPAKAAPEEYETVFARLWHHANHKPYSVKTTEAPHYRRFVLQQGGDPLAGPGGREDGGVRRGHRAPVLT